MSDEIFRFLKTNPQFESEVTEYLKCKICDTIMKNPCFTSCGCDFCHDCIVIYFENSSGNCPTCKKVNIDPDVIVNKSIQNKISKLRVKCNSFNCDVVDSVSSIVEHIRECDKRKMRCPYAENGCTNEEFEGLAALNCHFNTELMKHNTILLEQNRNMKAALTECLENMTKIDTNSSKLIQENADLKNKIEANELRFIEEINNIKKELKKNNITTLEIFSSQDEMLWNGLGRVNYGDYVWKLDKLSDRRKDAVKNKNDKNWLDSEVFYTHKCGYKMKLGCWINGYKEDEGTHLTFGLVIMKGEFDNNLPWPYKRLVKLSVVNERTSASMGEYSFHIDTTKTAFKNYFNKPTTIQNAPLSTSNFISWTRLTTPSNLIINNSISVKCTTSL